MPYRCEGAFTLTPDLGSIDFTSRNTDEFVTITCIPGYYPILRTQKCTSELPRNPRQLRGKGLNLITAKIKDGTRQPGVPSQ